MSKPPANGGAKSCPSRQAILRWVSETFKQPRRALRIDQRQECNSTGRL